MVGPKSVTLFALFVSSILIAPSVFSETPPKTAAESKVERCFGFLQELQPILQKGEDQKLADIADRLIHQRGSSGLNQEERTFVEQLLAREGFPKDLLKKYFGAAGVRISPDEEESSPSVETPASSTSAEDLKRQRVKRANAHFRAFLIIVAAYWYGSWEMRQYYPIQQEAIANARWAITHEFLIDNRIFIWNQPKLKSQLDKLLDSGNMDDQIALIQLKPDSKQIAHEFSLKRISSPSSGSLRQSFTFGTKEANEVFYNAGFQFVQIERFENYQGTGPTIIVSLGGYLPDEFIVQYRYTKEMGFIPMRPN